MLCEGSRIGVRDVHLDRRKLVTRLEDVLRTLARAGAVVRGGVAVASRVLGAARVRLVGVRAAALALCQDLLHLIVDCGLVGLPIGVPRCLQGGRLCVQHLLQVGHVRLLVLRRAGELVHQVAQRLRLILGALDVRGLLLRALRLVGRHLLQDLHAARGAVSDLLDIRHRLRQIVGRLLLGARLGLHPGQHALEALARVAHGLGDFIVLADHSVEDISGRVGVLQPELLRLRGVDQLAVLRDRDRGSIQVRLGTGDHFLLLLLGVVRLLRQVRRAALLALSLLEGLHDVGRLLADDAREVLLILRALGLRRQILQLCELLLQLLLDLRGRRGLLRGHVGHVVASLDTSLGLGLHLLNLGRRLLGGVHGLQGILGIALPLLRLALNYRLGVLRGVDRAADVLRRVRQDVGLALQLLHGRQEFLGLGSLHRGRLVQLRGHRQRLLRLVLQRLRLVLHLVRVGALGLCALLRGFGGLLLVVRHLLDGLGAAAGGLVLDLLGTNEVLLRLRGQAIGGLRVLRGHRADGVRGLLLRLCLGHHALGL
mmetsp:Transcript_33856/g.86768  ORF Transcript_33856/g.86768 Transcript_33856/m.86768 type:complete len:541 (+) Transcript_33856:201-1823(+)